MRRKSILVSLLYRLFTFLFWLGLIGLIYFFVLETFTKEGKIENFVSENHHSKGYSIPIIFNIDVKNPVFNSFKTTNKKEHTNKDGKVVESGNLEYFDKMSVDSNKESKNIISFYFEDELENFKTKDSNFRANGWLSAKSKNPFIFFLQMFRFYSVLIASVIVFFLLKKTFYLLKTELRFTIKLSQYIYLLGITFIAKTILELTISYIIGNYYESIVVKTILDGKTFSSGIQLSMNPRLEFEFTLFLVGLSLMVLASLLKSGNEIQQENDLTI